MDRIDLRHVDFDALKRHAHELRRQAIEQFFDQAAAHLRDALRRGWLAARSTPVRSGLPAGCR